MAAVTVNSIKSLAIADDGKSATVTFAGQYVREHSLKIPAECLDAILSALTEVRSAILAPAGAPRTSASPPVMPRSAGATHSTGASRNERAPEKSPAVAPPAASANITLRRAKNCIVAPETKSQKLVLVIFDFQLPQQSGYALDAVGAKALAADLVKNADIVLAATAKN